MNSEDCDRDLTYERKVGLASWLFLFHHRQGYPRDIPLTSPAVISPSAT